MKILRHNSAIKKTFSFFFLFLFLFSSLSAEEIVKLKNGQKALLMDDFTWSYVKTESGAFDFSSIRDNQIPDILRGGINCNAKTIKTAIEMYLDGWRYTMPMPKSNQARWGNSDGRTTWWFGYWHNEKTGLYSSSTPKNVQGSYVGDRQNNAGTWRRGGTPPFPTKIEWLLSNSEGVSPN